MLPVRASLPAGSRTPFRGWCWRGAALAPREIAAYGPGAVLKHLGPALAWTGEPRDFPVIFWIHAREGCDRLGDTGAVVFEPDAVFRVIRVDVMTNNRLCCFLEQATPGGQDGDLEAACEARLLETLPTPPPPGPELVEAFAGPFARWSVDAAPGDLPLLGVVYEAEEAARFASAWAGVDLDVVRRVLEARARYLMLAGLGGCEEDDGLIREREAVRHLLPETPGVIDDRETAYVMLATDLDEETVLRVTQGETAYLESLGLLTWEGDAWEGSLVLEGPPLREGHARHWEALLDAAGAGIPGFSGCRPGAEHLRFHVPTPDLGWEGVSLYALPGGPNLETGVLVGEGREGAGVLSTFPLIRDGAPFFLELHGSRVWEGGCEAVVFASSAFAGYLPFFDAGHLHPWNGDRAWGGAGPVEVRLAGLAYQVEPADAGGDAFGLAPCPWREAHPDDHAFHGRLRAVSWLEAWGRRLCRLELELAGDGLPPLPIYAAEARLATGWEPGPGAWVSGRLWLQGSAVPLGSAILFSGEA